MATPLLSSLSISPENPNKTLKIPIHQNPLFSCRLSSKDIAKLQSQPSVLDFGGKICTCSRMRLGSVSSKNLSSIPSEKKNYEFYDADTEVELRLNIVPLDIHSSSDIFVDTDETSVLIRVKASGRLTTLMESNCLFDRIKPAETIWYLDEDQLAVNPKKYDRELKWPDLIESWESLQSGVMQLLNRTSIYIIGDSTEMNHEVARELVVGLGYTPLNTSELLENYAQQSIDSWVISEGADSVAEAESSILEGFSSHVRTVVATLGGQHGAARRHDKWRRLHTVFSVWLSKSEVTDEASAKEETRKAYRRWKCSLHTNADVVVKTWWVGCRTHHSRCSGLSAHIKTSNLIR